MIGALASAGVSILALRFRSLSRSGAIASTIVGTVAVAAGWSWGILLLAFFLSSTALSRLGADRKAARINAIVAKSGNRDVWQVLANGGLFAVAAIASLVSPAPIWPVIGVGALAASAADTWSTEIGTLLGGEPRSIVSGARVPAGTSGGISTAGVLASGAGAGFMALAAWLAGLAVPVYAVIAGGVAGALADSLLGATIQERRWCEVCRAPTERTVHVCGATTTRAGGIAGFDNDAVNFACSCVGALVALLMS